MVLGNNPRRVQDLGATGHGRIEEGLHCLSRGCNEDNVRLTKALAILVTAKPEVRELRALTDNLVKVRNPASTERGQHRVIEVGAGSDV